MTPKEMALTAAKALDEKKGGDIAAIEITEQTTLRTISSLPPAIPTPRSTPCAAQWRRP